MADKDKRPLDVEDHEGQPTTRVEPIPGEQEVFGQEAFKVNMKRLVARELDLDTQLSNDYATMHAQLNSEYVTEKQQLRDQYMQDRNLGRERLNLALGASRETSRFGFDRMWAGSDTAQGAVDVATVRSVSDMQVAIDSIHSAIAALPNVIAMALADLVTKPKATTP